MLSLVEGRGSEVRQRFVLSLAEGRRREGDVGLIEYAQVVDNLLVSDSWLHGQERAHEDGWEHE